MPSFRFGGIDCDCCDPGNFDILATKKKNFYQFTNKGWKEKNPLKKEYASWNNFMILRDGNLDKLKEILSELDAAGGVGDTGAAAQTETDKVSDQRRLASSTPMLTLTRTLTLNRTLTPTLTPTLTLTRR